jgi:acetyl esterase/lipase
MGSVMAISRDKSWTLEKDISFLGAHREERLDLYRPKKSALRPAVLYIHGGAFYKGDKASPRSLSICPDLAEAGYIVASINYKLSQQSEGDARWSAWPQNLEDCRAGWRFLIDHASDFGIDTNRLVVMGTSAGATLALLLAFTLREKIKAAALINFYGRVDWFSDTVPHRRHSSLEVMRQASPVHFLDSPDQFIPPTLTVHGDADAVVPLSHASALDQEYSAQGMCHELFIVKGGGHGFDLRPEQADLRPRVLEFLSRYLK